MPQGVPERSAPRRLPSRSDPTARRQGPRWAPTAPRVLLVLALVIAPALSTAAMPFGDPAAALPPRADPPPAVSPSANPPGAPRVSLDTPASSEDARRTLRHFAANLGRGTLGIFAWENLAPLIVGGSATAVAFFADDRVRDAVSDPGGRFGRVLETGAGPVSSTIFVAGMFTAGRLTSSPRFRAMTYDMAEAAVVTTGYSGLLKIAVRRERPDGNNRKSFPSSHTSNAFALAAAAEGHYGWKIGAPAYGFAALVAASRVRDDAHYLSDVVAGATLGYIVGRTTVRLNSAADGADGAGGAGTGPRLAVSPVLAAHTRAAVISVAFR